MTKLLEVWFCNLYITLQSLSLSCAFDHCVLKTKILIRMAVGYFEAFVKTWRNHWVEWKKRGLTKTFLKDFIDNVSTDFYISANDILLCVVLGIFFTAARFFLNEAVFKVRGQTYVVSSYFNTRLTRSPATFFCKKTVRRSKYCLENSKD